MTAVNIIITMIVSIMCLLAPAFISLALDRRKR